MRPERRLSGRNDGAAQAAREGQPFWRESGKSQGFGDGVPKSLRRERFAVSHSSAIEPIGYFKLTQRREGWFASEYKGG